MGILGVILIAFLARQGPLPATASIRGTVVRLGTSEPVAKAVVQLTGSGSSEPLAVATGADGRFEFRNLVPGSYGLTASRSGYLNTAFGQRGPSGTGRNLTIEAGVNLDDIRLLMTATGAISGRVFDNSGEPLADVPVQALKYSYAEGQRTLTQVKVDETNDLGEFRLFWLPPGQYYITAQPVESTLGKFIMVHEDVLSATLVNGRERNSPAQRLGEAYVPVYYPGTADPQSASRVEVRPGADTRGIDFSLARVGTRKVRGTVIDGSTGQPADSGVQLVSRGDRGAALTFAGVPSDGGRFEISGVIPGSYFLVATARLGSPNDVRIMGGRTPVEVGASDLDNLVVTLQPAIDIAGTVAVEGRPEGLPADAHPVVTLQGRRDAIPSGMANVYASFSSGTQFAFNSVIEGDYRVVCELPPEMYLKSVMVGPVDALNGGVHIDSRTTDRIQIVLGANAGTLEGVVSDVLRKAVAGARIALVPDAAHRSRADLYRTTMSDESGRFRLQGIPPGDYSLFAWEDIENGLWQDSEFLQRHEASGRPVRIVENGRETIEAVAIPFAF